MKNIKPLHLGIILLVVSAFFVLLVLRADLTGEARYLGGPNAIAVQGERVFIVYRNRLLVLSSQGELLSEFSRSSLGENVVVSDMQATSDGLLLGILREGNVHRCYIDPFRCEIFSSAVSGLRSPFKFYLTDAGDLWVSEGPRSRLLRHAPAAEWLSPVDLPDSGLNAPNRVLWVDGRIVIADTNNHRIVGYETGVGEQPLREAFSFAANDHPQARSGRSWPTDVAYSGGKWWTLNGDGLLADADLLAFTPDGTPLMRVDLPAESDPISLIASGGSLLATDYSAYAVYQVDSANGEWHYFGDNAFRQLMQQGREEVEMLEGRAQLYLFGMIALLVLGFVLALWFERGRIRAQGWSSLLSKPADMENKAQSQVITDAARPGVQWFVPDRKKMRWVRWGFYYMLGITLLMPSFVLFLPGDAGELAEKLIPVMWPYFFLWVSLLGLEVVAQRQFRNRLGFDGTDLLFRDDRMLVRRVPAAEVVYTPRAIHHQHLSIPLQNGRGGAFYSTRALDLMFQGLLIPARKVNEWQVFVYQLKHRHPVIMLTLIMFVLFIVMQVVK